MSEAQTWHYGVVARWWAEFNLDGAEWRIPAERMKAREQHIVPGQADVTRVGPVPVQDGRNPARAPLPAGGALAELVARLGGDAYLGHGNTPQRLPG